MTQPTPGAPQAAPPVCPRHPDRVSYVRCQRCDRPTCPECQVPAPVGILCVDCAREANAAATRNHSAGAVMNGRSTPLLTYGLIAANVAFYLYGQATGYNQWWNTFGLYAPIAFEPTELYRWLTSGFVHGGVLHIGLNMLMLFQFGSQLERVIGRAWFAVLYFGSLLGGSLSIALLGGSNSLHGGASGAIFGLFAAFGVLLYRLKLPWQSIAAQAGIWLAAGFFVAGISWQGHLGGAIAGAVVMAFYLTTGKGKTLRRR